MAIYFYDNKILMSPNSEIAVGEDCCCGGPTAVCDIGPATTTGPKARTDAPRVDITITWTGSPASYSWGGYQGQPALANAVKFTKGETKTICPVRYARRPTTTDFPSFITAADMNSGGEQWSFADGYVTGVAEYPTWNYAVYNSYDFLNFAAGVGGTCFPFLGKSSIFNNVAVGRCGGGVPFTSFTAYFLKPRGYPQGTYGGVGFYYQRRVAASPFPTGGPPPTPSTSRCANVTSQDVGKNQQPFLAPPRPSWTARTYSALTAPNLVGQNICQQHIEDALFSSMTVQGDSQYGNVTLSWVRSASSGGQKWKKSNTNASPWV